MIYLCIVVMTFVGATASIFLKKASGSDGLLEMIKNVNLYIGGVLYVASALINIFVLRYLDYSVVLPMTSFTYIWTMVLAYVLLKEKISTKKIIGVLCIVAGAVCVAI